ncbi:bifunctional helix-turn-helix transcriptional regulator/GNAT family N-acetyltransferase [Conexibacter arvalis]|uniref:DNA-binding MarR family transcriptional regulator/GNAT superfamily N-acetyltransferase n=1 Tax=Conexibacter arvalis TaxID=912552 RepID=A0A840IAD8_9ACTN|nr:bifunctional helix-turn-helix transcriptional regulator/GNAT family N-acetyltransferase [Conexibacter arvalis]MBB4661806.1 DNA-binding MarR family transcriptional regulator/GNAT superfamily N-acetyltransferase [Conexibacter arvalis]
MDDASVQQVRRFNRSVTQRVGALDDRYLARDRPLGEARLLWEIGPGGCEVRALRTRLGLDSGHASRLLRALERDGLVEVVAGARDGRVRTARLTTAGRAERALLDERSDELARAFLAPLSARQRERLVGAMGEVERLLTAALVELGPADPAEPDARFCIRSYFDELDRRSESGFDPAAGIQLDPRELRPPAGVLLLARLRAEPIGCGAVRLHGDGPAEIRRMWVAEAARGLGVGRRLLGELEAWAVARGARVARLETNRALAEAISLYRSSGYREVAAFNDEPFADHWFEKRLDGTDARR